MLLLGSKAITNLFSMLIKKQRNHFANKGPCSQSYDFSSSWLYRFESWTIKKAEHQRTDAFELFCCRRLLRIPRTAKK